MKLQHYVLVALFACAVSVVALAAALKVQPDKENVVASRLEGRWRVHAELTERLTGRPGERKRTKEYEFKSDPAVVEKIPAKYNKFLDGKHVYMAGVMSFRPATDRLGEHAFLLVELRGNPHLVWFWERDGDPMGDAESFNLVVAPAKDRKNDLLFIGGDFNNQPFSAFERVAQDAE